MEALLLHRVTKYAHILGSPKENKSKYIEGHTFTMATKRMYCVSSLETSPGSTCSSTSQATPWGFTQVLPKEHVFGG